jgi:hypothetical protein
MEKVKVLQGIQSLLVFAATEEKILSQVFV